MSLARLGDHAKFLSGFAFKSKLFNNDGTGLPVIRIRDVVRGRSETFYSGNYDDRYVVSRGDYLIGMDGEFNLSQWQSERALLNQRVCKIDSISDNVDRDYLARFLPLALKEIEDATPFVTVKHLSVKTLNEIQIPLPPLAEQKRIAGILDAADALRAKRRESIALLDALLQSTFLEMFGDPVTNPMGWNVKKLKDISNKILNGTTPKGGREVYVEEGILFFRSQNVWRNRIELDDTAYIDRETHLKMRKSSLLHKDILITKTGRINTENSSLGRAAMFLGADDSANINGHVYLVRLNKEIIHEFVLFILTTDEYREYIRRVCVGGIDKRQINKQHLEEFPIIFPPLEQQRRFAAIAETVGKQKVRLQTQLAELDALFASLQHRAFAGEL